MRRAIKIRIYPNAEERKSLDFQFGAVRWIYNNSLAHRKQAWEDSKTSISKKQLMERLVHLKADEATEWLKEADSQALQQSIHHLDRAYQNFFEHRSRFPQFKSRRDRQAIAYPQRVRVDQDRIYLPKIGWVKAVVHREIRTDGPEEGRVEIKTVVVSKTTTDKYYASVLVEDGLDSIQKPTTIDTAVGIDLGLTDFAVTTAGDRAGNPRHLRKREASLKRRQRELSRKKRGSANRAKARTRLAVAHERVANARSDFQHKLSRRLVDENQAICLETLGVRGMMKNSKLSKSIGDAAWSSFVQKLSYKAEWAGRHVVFIDRFHPSSKTCSSCGVVQPSMPLSIRTWQCGDCGESHDRDVNAAMNIRREGLKLLRTAGITVRGDVSRTPVEMV